MVLNISIVMLEVTQKNYGQPLTDACVSLKPPLPMLLVDRTLADVSWNNPMGEHEWYQ
jgi:hypothetical protein